MNIDLVLLDIWLGDNMDGMTALEKIHEQYQVPVIMISGHGTIETAVQATRKGAFDFIEKPLSYDKIILAISNGLRFAKLRTGKPVAAPGLGAKTDSHRGIPGHPELKKTD